MLSLGCWDIDLGSLSILGIGVKGLGSGGGQESSPFY